MTKSCARPEMLIMRRGAMRAPTPALLGRDRLRAGLAVAWLCTLAGFLVPSEAAEPLRPGQRQVLLPSGDALITGPRGGEIPASGAAIRDRVSGTVTGLPSGPLSERAWHSATVLPNGAVLLYGGIDQAGSVLSSAELYDPASRSFTALPDAGLLPRAHHAAALLTDGRLLIIGGVTAKNAPVSEIELWDWRTQAVGASSTTLAVPRIDPQARLLADGTVEIAGGTDANSKSVPGIERYDPSSGLLTVHNAAAEGATLLQFAGAVPAEGESAAPVDGVIAVRFNAPVRIDTLGPDTVLLSGPGGAVKATVIGAEGGRLAFLAPHKPLAPGSEYQVSIRDVRGATGLLVPAARFTFRTADLAQDSADGAGGSSARAAARRAAAGEDARNEALAEALRSKTGLTGVLKTLDDRPLANVTLEVQGKKARSDAGGKFTIRGLSAGRTEVWIDARSANRAGKTYGTFLVGVDLKAGEVTEYPQVMWMPEIDTKHAVNVASPTAAEVVVTHPALPDFEVRIPKGTTITDRDGKPVASVSLTPVPFGKIPFPMVPNYPFKAYYTIQPGGATLYNHSYQRTRIYYPNWNKDKPGSRYIFHLYEPDKGWDAYGLAEVGDDGRQIIPAPGTGIYEFTGAGTTPGSPPGTPPCTDPLTCMPCPCKDPKGNDPQQAGKEQAGEPVTTSTGLFVHGETDFTLPDVVPISLNRTYVSGDTVSRAFGIGWNHGYDIYLYWQTAWNWSKVQLVLPNGGRITFPRISGTSYLDAVYENSDLAGPFYKAIIKYGVDTRWYLTRRDGSVWTFTHTLTLLQSMSDRHSNVTTLVRATTNGPVTKIVSPNGRSIALTYDGSNRVTRAEDHTGRAWTYSYDASGRLYTATDPNGGVRYYTYDTSHRLLTYKDPRGNFTITNEYYTDGRVKKQTYPDATTTQFAYTVDGNGKVTQTDVTDRSGKVRRLQFDAYGYVSTDTFALGQSEEQVYTFTRQSGTNFLTDETDAVGRVTHYTYDSEGNLASLTRMYGTGQATTWTYTYEPRFRQLASVTDPLDHTTTYSYDTAGNLLEVSDPLDHTTTLTYNGVGQVTSVSDGLNHTTAFGYQFGDLVSITDALSRTVNFSVDPLGRVVATRDALGNATVTTYDPLDRVTKITDALGGEVQFGYDANGNLTSHTDPRNNTMQYSYDAMNRLVTRQDALSKTESFVYDAGGRLQRFTDRKGQVSGFGYDALGRRTSAGFGATTGNPTAYSDTISYTYDDANRLTQAVDSIAGSFTRQYDARFDALTQEVTPQGQVDYTYDAAGRRAGMTVSGQSAVSYTFDVADRLTQISQGSASVSIAYDAADRRSTLTLANGVLLTYGYDNAGQLTGIAYANGGGSLGNLSYTYDLAGRRVSVGGSFARTNLPAALASASYDANNRVSAWGATTPTHDDNGNLTGDGTNSYGWDARNRLASISGGASASFVYDPFGRRQSKTIGSAQTGFVYDGANVVREKSGSSVKAELLAGLGIDEVFARTQSSTTSHMLTDALGSVIALANASAGIATEYTYEPYGATTQSGAANENTQQYTGRENDGTGLYYYRARYYHPQLGRFVAEDPIGLDGGTNLYAYVNGNPVLYVDPEGKSWIGAAGRIVGGMVAGAITGAMAGAVMAYITDAPVNPAIYQGAVAGAIVGGGVAAFGPSAATTFARAFWEGATAAAKSPAPAFAGAFFGPTKEAQGDPNGRPCP